MIIKGKGTINSGEGQRLSFILVVAREALSEEILVQR